MSVQPLLSIKGITKAYPGVVANDDVSFDIPPGEVHALLGENGAGKSTLVKMIYGLVRPDAGSMTLNGAAFTPPEPRAARAAEARTTLRPRDLAVSLLNSGIFMCVFIGVGCGG